MDAFPAPTALGRVPVRRLRRRGLTVLLIGALLAGAVDAVDAAVSPSVALADPTTELTPEEVEAQAALDEARARREAAEAEALRLSSALDVLAADYEQAAAQALVLADEHADADAAADVAAAAGLDARRTASDRLAAMYRNPAGERSLIGAVLESDDAGTALHRAALVGRLPRGNAVAVASADRAEARSRQAAADSAMIAAGVGAAAEDSRLAADALRDAMTDARARIDVATAAESAATDAVAEARAAGDVQRAFAAAGPLPPVGGMVCPIGVPHGFIDSWGFPRSGGRTHQGVDMFADHGMPLFAVADGRVDRVSWNRLGGLSIHLVDDLGNRYYYAHLSEALVAGGERVAAGAVVGLNGDTGNARGTPPHLHFQYHPGGGAAVNPYPLTASLCGR